MLNPCAFFFIAAVSCQSSPIDVNLPSLLTLNVLVLQDKYPNAMLKKLSPVDKFILDHHFLFRRARNRMKVVEL